jgi:hypothetical protein
VNRQADWWTDRAGHASGHTGLTVFAFDLAKHGQLIDYKGEWGSVMILSQEWVNADATNPSQPGIEKLGAFCSFC